MTNSMTDTVTISGQTVEVKIELIRAGNVQEYEFAQMNTGRSPRFGDLASGRRTVEEASEGWAHGARVWRVSCCFGENYIEGSPRREWPDAETIKAYVSGLTWEPPKYEVERPKLEPIPDDAVMEYKFISMTYKKLFVVWESEKGTYVSRWGKQEGIAKPFYQDIDWATAQVLRCEDEQKETDSSRYSVRVKGTAQPRRVRLDKGIAWSMFNEMLAEIGIEIGDDDFDDWGRPVIRGRVVEPISEGGWPLGPDGECYDKNTSQEWLDAWKRHLSSLSNSRQLDREYSE